MKNLNQTEALRFVHLQPMMTIKKPYIDLYCPVLRFGKKKSGEFKFPIVFKNRKQADKLYDELEKLKGKTIDEVRAAADVLYEKFKKYHYK
ncbi:MAG: hypothetical protein A3F72_03050 [Bacteroidetes bacterium RIFCSPLOWO2_12_FULL_35_15]|nr:MAG: hypothetical protein A3F72_03050 [Bacteroidetes bacterium RIFCSPLOWO2_12_FULL_35_15]